MRRSLPELEQTLGMARARLHARLGSDALDADQKRELTQAIEALEALWEEVNLQARLISRDRRRYARFFEHVPEACVITTPVGRICDANRAALELLGSSVEKIHGAPLAGFLPDVERMQFTALLSAMASRKTRLEEQTWNGSLRTATSADLPVAMRMRAVTLANGGVRELCWLIRPVN